MLPLDLKLETSIGNNTDKIISILFFFVDKEQLIRYKFRWAEADDEPQDNQLHIDEFKAFRHPEQSRNMLTKMVQDILDNLGKPFYSVPYHLKPLPFVLTLCSNIQHCTAITHISMLGC